MTPQNKLIFFHVKVTDMKKQKSWASFFPAGFVTLQQI